MSVQAIPVGIDISMLYELCNENFGRGFVYDGNSPTPPTSVTFTPDLTPSEVTTFARLVDAALSVANFKNLPNWSTWTSQEASDWFNANIWNGLTQAQVNSYVDTTIVNITTANVNQINAQLANIRTVIKTAATAVIAIRTALSAMAKALIYIRNLILIK